MLTFDILCTVVASDWCQYVVDVLYYIAYGILHFCVLRSPRDHGTRWQQRV